MEKTPRYTQRERNMVLGFAAQYRDVIENKRTDAESNRRKDEIWRIISKEFNARVYHQRTSKQLRQLYKNMKLLLKKDLCNESGSGTVANNLPGLATKTSPKNFIDILTSLSQQSSVNQLITTPPLNNGTNSNCDGSGNGGNTNGYYNSRQLTKADYDDDSRLVNTIGNYNNNQMENDIVVIKSEDISDNEQSSSGGHNGIDMEDDDDGLSTKDIPEVCLEEEDEDLYPRGPEKIGRNGGRMGNGLPSMGSGLHHHMNDNSTLNESSSSLSPNKDLLMALTIEERQRKIELLNAQIEYWKTLTKKLETNSNNNGANGGLGNNNSDSNTTLPPTPSCHCHLSTTARINGISQS